MITRGLRTGIKAFAAALVVAVAALGCGKPPVTPTPNPPTLTCPANITMPGVTGAAKNVTYAAPAAAGGAPPVTTTCTPVSDSAFPLGATTVNCTAIDSLQRQAACSFVVTLEPLGIEVRRIVAFGDSVTAGEDGRRLRIRVAFVDPLRAYPTLLHNRLAADFPSQTVDVLNEGRGGEFASDGVRRLRDDVLPRHQPDTLLILEGYNDLLNRGTAAVNDVVGALREDVRIAKGRGVARVLVSTITPSRPATGPFNRSIDPRAIQETNAKLREMAAEEGAVLVNAFDAFAGRERELVEDDGLHLTPAGNEVLAAAFYDAIRLVSGPAGAVALRR